MEAINKNWTDADGNHAGGQSIGNLFTIAWQRGPLKEAGRNGAFLIEVLDACLEWMQVPCQAHIAAYGIGFTIIFGIRDIPELHRIQTLKEVLAACLDQACYYQQQQRFACEENKDAIGHLKNAIKSLPDIKEAITYIEMAQLDLVMRRDRRDKDEALGTNIGEAGTDGDT